MFSVGGPQSAEPGEIRGTDGPDTIRTQVGDFRIYGGAGNDLILRDQMSGSARITLDGGDGDDDLSASAVFVTEGGTILASLVGGAGNDEITMFGEHVGGVADGGDGDDLIRISSSMDDITVRLGVGGDDLVRYILYAGVGPRSVPRIEQFRAGDTGDALHLGLIEVLQNWDQSNPFAGGYLRLTAAGADTLVQIDEDGGGDGFRDLLRITQVQPYELTAKNFYGYPPSGGETLGEVFEGPFSPGQFSQIDATSGPDTITGYDPRDLIHAHAGNDVISSGGGPDEIHAAYGDDTVSAGGGNDVVYGSFGSNYLRGDEGDDLVVGGSGFDDINGNAGNDTCVSGGGDDWVVGGKDNDSLTGSAGQNLVYGNLGADTCDGGDGNDIVRGGQENDVVTGGAGDDFVSGDKGSDTMTGGAGADIFHTFGDAGLDRVVDFSLAQGDRVQLDPGTQYTVSQSGADTVINMTGGGQMILVGVQMSSLTAGWIFGA